MSMSLINPKENTTMMNVILAIVKSNIVHFDPSNAEHRKLAAVYFKNRSWKHTLTRFSVEYPFSNVVTMMSMKLTAYYTSAEFPTLFDTET
jgi:hypothetical protein